MTQMSKPSGNTALPDREYTADLVRVILFAGVVIAHSINYLGIYNDDVERSIHLAGTLGHMTRYGFVAVTLFVLVMSMRGRTMTPMQFWRRRFGLVVVPYLAWSLIYSVTNYFFVNDNGWSDIGGFFAGLPRNMLLGDAKYQMYFLLISMQIYLFFPLIQWVLDRVAHRPWTVITVAGTLQLGIFFAYQAFFTRIDDVDSLTFAGLQLWKTLPMYILFVAIGALGAYHYEAIKQWIRQPGAALGNHKLMIILGAVAAGAFTTGTYLWQTEPGHVTPGANTAWNPTTLPWYIGGFALLWLVSMMWDDRRASGKPAAAGLVSYATLRAFGVFAVHPLILDILYKYDFVRMLNDWFGFSLVLQGAVLVIVCMGLSLLLVDVLLRTPISKQLMARPQIPISRG